MPQSVFSCPQTLDSVQLAYITLFHISYSSIPAPLSDVGGLVDRR